MGDQTTNGDLRESHILGKEINENEMQTTEGAQLIEEPENFDYFARNAGGIE